MEDAAEKRPVRVVIVYSILEADRLATIGSVTGFGFLLCDLFRWEVTPLLQSHRLREGPAPVQELVPGLFGWTAAADRPTVEDCCPCPARMSRRIPEKAQLRGPLPSPGYPSNHGG
jgi:hypothetical protein